MNPFLIPGELPDWQPRRFYALLDSIEPEAPTEGEPITTFFEAVNADQFDDFARENVGDEQFFARLQINVLELQFPGAAALADWGFPLNDHGASWREIDVYDSGELLILQYRNLFDVEPIPRYLNSGATVPRDATVRRLESEFSLDDVLDATHSEIRGLLDALREIEFAVVYDVGQGNWNGLCDADGFPLLYFDFGGGVKQHSKTFPSALIDFCSTKNPPVVLSHWDWDHWCSGQRFPQATQLKWIAPRQRLGAVHRTFAQSLVQNNNLLLWPSGPSAPGEIEGGQVRIEKCTQAGRNHSGLALILSENRRLGGQQMLFTGDARYSAIPSERSSSFTAIVVPHHGADMRSNYAPTCPGSRHNRLAYSFGDSNTYGHPRAVTERRHQSQGWNHAHAVVRRGLAAWHVRRTIDRKTNGLGHISLHWQPNQAPKTMPCGGKHCSLGATQF